MRLVWQIRSPHRCRREFVMRTSEPKPHEVGRFASVLSIPKFANVAPQMTRTSESGHQAAVYPLLTMIVREALTKKIYPIFTINVPSSFVFKAESDTKSGMNEI